MHHLPEPLDISAFIWHAFRHELVIYWRFLVARMPQRIRLRPHRAGVCGLVVFGIGNGVPNGVPPLRWIERDTCYGNSVTGSCWRSVRGKGGLRRCSGGLRRYCAEVQRRTPEIGRGLGLPAESAAAQ